MKEGFYFREYKEQGIVDLYYFADGRGYALYHESSDWLEIYGKNDHQDPYLIFWMDL